MSDSPTGEGLREPRLFAGKSSLLYAWLITFLAWVMLMGIADQLAPSLRSLFEAPVSARFALTIPAFILVWFVGPWVARQIAGPIDGELGLDRDAGRAFLYGLAFYVPLGLIWWIVQLVYTLGLKAVGVSVPAQSVVAEFAQTG